MEAAEASDVLRRIIGPKCVDIAIDDGCHSIRSIEITFEAMLPSLATNFVYFIEDNFETYERLSPRHPEFFWTTRGEIAVATNR